MYFWIGSHEDWVGDSKDLLPVVCQEKGSDNSNSRGF